VSGSKYSSKHNNQNNYQSKRHTIYDPFLPRGPGREMKTTAILSVVLLRRYLNPIVYHLLLAVIWNDLLSSIGREWFLLSI
jgi:hypothetical protein